MEPLALSLVRLTFENINSFDVTAKWFRQLKSENLGVFSFLIQKS